MSVLDNIGYVAKATYYPCVRPNPWLIAEAAGNAIAPVLISAASFSCLDLVRMRAGISPWHSRGLRMLINDAIPPAQKNEVNKIYKFVIPLEKLLFVWFIADLTTEFTARWQSQIFKLGACGVPSDNAAASGHPVFWASPGNNKFSTIAVNNFQVEGQHGYIIPPYLIVPSGYSFTVSWTMEIQPWYPDDPPTWVDSTIMRISGTPFMYQPMRSEPGWLTGNLSTFYQSPQIPPQNGTTQYVLMASSDKGCRSIGGSFAAQVSSTPIYNKGVFPVNCFGVPLPSANVFQ